MRSAKLILGSNSIGNDKDVPQRTLEAIRNSDLLVFEEDRPARRLLKLAGVHRDYFKHNEHKDRGTLEEVRKFLLEGKSVFYCSDQGTASLADPGKQLSQIAFEMGVSIEVIPGPSSVTAAISACPFDCSKFHYVGFLPRDEKDRLKVLEQIAKTENPQIILDAPYRLKALLESCKKTLQKNKKIFLALDISGEDESYLYDEVEIISEQVSKINKKLNFVLII